MCPVVFGPGTVWHSPGPAWAKVDGVTGTFFAISARAGYISLADGNALYSWGYSLGATMQYPGPTLIVNQGDTVTVTLTNMLPAAAGNVSIVFPGQAVTALGGVTGAARPRKPRRTAASPQFPTHLQRATRAHMSTIAGPSRNCRWRWA